MNKKIIKGILSIVFMVIFLGLFTTCFSGYGADIGNLTINLGSNARSAMPWPPDGDEYILDKINYEITLIGNDETKTFLAKGGDTIRATVSVGLWNVSIKAFYQNELYATGENTVDVKAGQNNIVTVQMKKAFDDPSDPDPVPATYTVTFNSNGGSAVASITGLDSGDTITAPTDPTRTDYIFQGWYEETGFTNKWAFATDTVTSSITLHARWTHINGPFEIGDTGPGGGKIYYRNETGFTVQMVNPAENYTAHYLEAAPSNSSTSAQWGASGTLIDGVTTFTSTSDAKASEIGNGRKDTQIIVTYLGTTETGRAAQLCASADFGGKNDWFLPSLEELYLYYQSDSSLTSRPTSGVFWSSSQIASSNAWGVNFLNGDRGLTNKGSGISVRAVRAF